MVKFLIHKPVAVIVVFVALALLGAIAITKIPVSPLPDIDIPEITVHVSKKNTSSKDFESTVVNGLRTQLLQVPGLQDIHSETRDGYGILHLRLAYGTDIDYAFIQVNEKIDLSMNVLPRDMERPRVIKASATDIPIFNINLSFKKSNTNTYAASRFVELSQFAEQIVKRRLEQLPEIAFVDISGASRSAVYIMPDKAAMAAMRLEVDDFKRIVTGHNLLSGDITAMDGGLQYNVRFASNKLLSVEDIRNISFKYAERAFKLSDIATIELRESDKKGSFLANNQRAICLAIIKQPNTKLETLRYNVASLLDNLKKDYPDIEFEQTQDETELLELSITNLKQDLFIGSFLAFILMFFFLKNVRSPFLIGISVPISLVLSILFFKIFNLSINIISLSGLVLGVGLMIDNSIIVIDNISQFTERKLTLSEACSKGTNEIIRPLISSVLTTCSVFLPLIFLSGISGALFYEQAMAITIGLVMSLIVSITLLPTLYQLIHKENVRKLEIKFFDKFGINLFSKLYEYGFNWVFKYKLLACLVVILLVVSNVFVFTHLRREKLPEIQQAELVTYIDWNRNITVSENENRISSLLRSIQDNLLQSNCQIGEQQFLLSKEKELSASEAKIYIKAKNADSLDAIKDKIRSYIGSNFQYAAVTMGVPKNIFKNVFGDDEPPLIVELKEPGKDMLPPGEKVSEIIRLMHQSFPSLAITSPPVQHSLVLTVDPERLLLYDLSLQDVYVRLKGSLSTDEVATIPDGQKNMSVVVADKTQDLYSVLNNVTVRNKRGIQIPVGSFIKVYNEETYKTIEGSKKGNYIPLSIETKDPEALMKYLDERVKAGNTLDVSYAGSFFSNQALIDEMVVVLVVAVMLLYFILAAQFESLVQPVIVLLELPISMSGALMMLYVFDSSINLISLIGFVVMSGIIINDSILKIDIINQLHRREGFSLMDAIHIGGKRRLQSIVMTSITTILSVLPFLFGNDVGSVLQRPLSLALIGGMVIGTPVSLYFIPLVYWFYYRNKKSKVLA